MLMTDCYCKLNSKRLQALLGVYVKKFRKNDVAWGHTLRSIWHCSIICIKLVITITFNHPQIARSVCPTYGVHLGSVGPRWAPCWPYEPCYQGHYASQVNGYHWLHVSKGQIILIFFTPMMWFDFTRGGFHLSMAGNVVPPFWLHWIQSKWYVTPH